MFGLKKTYKISLDDEESVTPEETLMDSGSSYSDMERPISEFIFRATFAAFSVLLSVILVFVFNIGILKNSYFSELAMKNRSANFSLSSPRGIIFDRFGKPLVKNVPSFDLLVISRELKKNSQETDSNINKIASILGMSPDIFKNSVFDSSKTNAMFFAASNLDKDKALAIKYEDLPGFYIVSNTRRYYIDGSKFSQLVGYVGKVSRDDLNDEYYYPTDIIGRLGLEAEYEKFLRGEHGNIFFSKGQTASIVKDPIIGNNLITNIDIELQKKLYDGLSEVLRQSGLSRAAAVIQNPKNGAVMALVSFPSFDNNIFISDFSDSDFKKLFENRSKPLFNRITSGLYNPGSTIKPFMGMTALQENIVTPADTIQDCISITVPNPSDKEHPYVFKNWRAEYGPFNLRKAIANSCNVYFFSVGGGFGRINGLGIERIVKYLKSSFADSKLGIDLAGEENGFLPTPDWKLNTKGEHWYLGDTYNTSIGQGDLLVTPLWLNGYIGAIANGGTFYKPQIASRVVDDGGVTLNTFLPRELGKFPFRSEVIQEVKKDMSETVMSGTAQLLKDLPVKVGAKTGTAEVIKGRSINSLFAAFAPFDNPDIVITVLVEGSASNQGLAIRVAHDVLKWYFNRGSEPVEASPAPAVSVPVMSGAASVSASP